MRKPDFSILQKPSIVLLLFCTCFSIWTMDVWRQWRYNDPSNHPFRWDVGGYYSYLPATFIGDFSFKFNNDLDWYIVPAPKGGSMSKGTYGMALMYSPFFALAYKISYNTHAPLDGLSYYFGTCIHWGSIFYGLLGLLILRNLLVKFFSEKVTAITIAIIFFGTNLFYYILGLSEFPHSYLFLLISSFMLTTYHWYRKPTFMKSVLLGLIIGLITLIRPTEILVVMLFIFWMMEDGIVARFRFLLSKYLHILVMGIAAFLIWLPQFMIWKYKTGHYVYFSYPGEQFFWGDPQIMNILFSYRKGWFVYTPLMLLAFAGFFFMNNKTKPMRFVILGLIVLNIYILSCWWDWFFGGSFGARCFIQHYSYLAIPLACFVRFSYDEISRTTWKPLLQTLITLVIFSGMCLNVMQSYQATQGMIHHNAMTKKTYWLIFGEAKFQESEGGQYWKSLSAPDYDKLRSGEKRDQ